MKAAVSGFRWPTSVFPGKKKTRQESISFCIDLSSWDFLKDNRESFHLHRGQFPPGQLKTLGATAQRSTQS